MSSEKYTQWFDEATAIAAEGARIGICSCKVCGAAILLDPRDKENKARKHAEWHQLFGTFIGEGKS